MFPLSSHDHDRDAMVTRAAGVPERDVDAVLARLAAANDLPPNDERRLLGAPLVQQSSSGRQEVFEA